MLSEKQKDQDLYLLDQAIYISQTVMNDKLNEYYEETRNKILGIDLQAVRRKRNEYYKALCKMKGLKFPSNY